MWPIKPSYIPHTSGGGHISVIFSTVDVNILVIALQCEHLQGNRLQIKSWSPSIPEIFLPCSRQTDQRWSNTRRDQYHDVFDENKGGRRWCRLVCRVGLLKTACTFKFLWLKSKHWFTDMSMVHNQSPSLWQVCCPFTISSPPSAASTVCCCDIL